MDLEKLNWKSVKFEDVGFNANFDGLIGIEECTDYGVVSNNIRKRGSKKEKSNRTDDCLPPVIGSAAIPPAQIEKLSAHEADVSLDNMQAWSQFNLPEVILKGLAIQNFTNPTMIQELTLPPAIFGRRDILGAAETGSGKTLAFGIPIINAILQLKQKPFMGVNETFRKAKKSKSDDVTKTKEQAKIINYNKLTPDERKLLRVKKNKKKKRRVYEDENEGSNDDEDNSDIDEDYSDVDEDNSDGDGDNSDGDDDYSDGEKDYSDIDEENSDVDEDNSSGDEDNSDGGEVNSAIIEDEKIAPDDFEENEEDVEGVNEKGIGCVKVIDNIICDDLPDVSEQRKCLKPLYALILTPTRELAIQVKNHLVAAAKFTDISVAVVVGGMSQEKQERLLSRGPEIVVATPGRLWQLVQLGNPHLSQIPDIKFLAIDETDRMLERGHFEELHQLLERLNENEEKRGGRQNFVFSATLTMVHDLPKHLKQKKVTKKGKVINRRVEKLTPDQKMKNVVSMLGITDPKIVDVTKQNQGASTTLTECRIMCPIEQKDYYLFYVLKRYPGRTIIFCNSIGCVKRLSQLFGLLQCNPLPLHANMQQRQRLKNLDRFRADPNGVLVATDVAARGLDIPDVEHVIHYQVPRTAENYVHRSGRTARASKEGITILIMEAGEVQNYNKMCKTLAKEKDLPHFPVDGLLLSAVMQRVDVARDLDLLMLKVRNDNTQKGWLEKAAKEMDMLLDERNMPRQLEQEAVINMKHILATRRKQLNSLLATPIFPKGFSFKYPTSNVQLNDALGLTNGQNAIDAMKSAIETGLVQKRKNATKNEAILGKNKWKKLRGKKFAPE